MGKTRRQHTVPQSYLARFCADGKQLFAFDKAQRRAFRTNIKNIAQEHHFYDMPEELLAKAFPEGGVDPQFMEKAFSRLEGISNGWLGDLLGAVEQRGCIPRHLRLQLAPYIIIQSMRTRVARDLTRELREREAEAYVYPRLRQSFPDVPEEDYPRVEYNKDLLSVVQAQHLLDEDHVVEMASLINRHIWFVGINRTIQPFYTSDHPVAKKANVQQPGRSFNGLRSPGIEIAFPLSSRHILVMLERSYFHRQAGLDGRAVPIDPFGVERYNVLQVVKCHRQVYCERNEFQQAEGVCRTHPEACSPDRPLVRVVRSGNVTGFLCQD